MKTEFGFRQGNLSRIAVEGTIGQIHGSVMSEWVLSEQTHAAIGARKWAVVVLPFRATEPLKMHMPYGTDVFQVEHVERRAGERASEAKRGAQR